MAVRVNKWNFNTVRIARLLFVALMICALIALPGFISATESTPRFGSTYDFGVVSTDSKLRHFFVIPHGGEDALEITNAKPSCDCVQILS